MSYRFAHIMALRTQTFAPSATRAARKRDAGRKLGKKSLNESRLLTEGLISVDFDAQGNPIPGTGGRDSAIDDYEDNEEE